MKVRGTVAAAVDLMGAPLAATPDVTVSASPVYLAGDGLDLAAD